MTDFGWRAFPLTIEVVSDAQVSAYSRSQATENPTKP